MVVYWVCAGGASPYPLPGVSSSQSVLYETDIFVFVFCIVFLSVVSVFRLHFFGFRQTGDTF